MTDVLATEIGEIIDSSEREALSNRAEAPPPSRVGLLGALSRLGLSTSVRRLREERTVSRDVLPSALREAPDSAHFGGGLP